MNPIEDGGCWRGAAGGASDGPFASVFHPIPLASSHLSGRPFLFLFISFSFLLLFFGLLVLLCGHPGGLLFCSSFYFDFQRPACRWDRPRWIPRAVEPRAPSVGPHARHSTGRRCVFFGLHRRRRHRGIGNDAWDGFRIFVTSPAPCVSFRLWCARPRRSNDPSRRPCAPTLIDRKIKRKKKIVSFRCE